MERRLGSGADAGWIAQPHAVSIGVEIEIDLPSDEFGVPGKFDFAAPGTRCQTLDGDLVLTEKQPAVDFTQSARQVDISNRAVLDLQLAFHQRRVEGTGNGGVSGNGSRAGEVRVIRLQYLQVDLAEAMEIQVAFACKL